MTLSNALKNGKAVYADGDRNAVAKLNGRLPDDTFAFDIYVHIKGEGHTTAVCITAIEMEDILQEKNIPLDRGWSDETRK